MKKLKETDIPLIRIRLEKGETQAAIASDYKVNPSQISEIKLRNTWGHI